ncbi:fork head domain-containing protein FD4-like [Limulus polyphemus]|uniref:Fork head domain-containing protein FD4-like n=1 Tax=Limulus polyphemus TaxID=6850 RepID=A0ABM1BML2_LIMPO|nr:fork head domain-containing protein FD4-like [Limulus polyphemus]
MSVPFVIKDLPVPTNISFGPRPVVANSAVLMEYQRLQFYEYIQATSNVRCEHPAFLPAYAIEPYSVQATVHGHPSLPFVSAPFTHFDFRGRFFHEEPKPQQSYIGLIAKAILSSAEKKLILSDIYQYILDNYPYFRNRGPGWRNSIRHNLSLNDCFIKAGRSANGKGHYWAIHPANVEDFKKGDFTRRKAQRKVRKHMGLDIAEEDDNSGSALPLESNHTSSHEQHQNMLTDFEKSEVTKSPKGSISTKRRMFDVESLLAPDHPEDTAKVNTTCSASGNTRVSPPSDLWVNNHHHNQYGCEKTLM